MAGSLISNQALNSFASGLGSSVARRRPGGYPHQTDPQGNPYQTYPVPGKDYNPAGVPEPTWGGVFEDWLFQRNRPRM